MSYARALLLAVVIAVLAVPATASAADLVGQETVFLDTFRAPQATVSNQVPTLGTLATGVTYTVVVSGTWSAYLPKYMKNPPPSGWSLCGTPEEMPTTPSATQPDSAAGQDAEVIFARPWPSPCPHPVPYGYDGFKMNTGSGFTHVTPIGGPFSAPQPEHTYTYQVVGQGQPISFVMFDANTADNDGVLKIVVSSPPIPGSPPPNTGTSSSGNSSSGNSSTVPFTSKTCLSRRNFRIHIVSHRSDPVTAASVRFHNKTQRLRLRTKKGRLIANVDLRGLKKGTNVVTIVARTRSGRTLVSHRVYHTCVERRLLVVHVKPRRDRVAPFRYAVTGRLLRSRNVPASACRAGRIVVTSRVGRRTLSTRRVQLSSSCRFSVRLSLNVPSKLQRRKVTISARFLGNKRLKAAKSWPLTVKAG